MNLGTEPGCVLSFKISTWTTLTLFMFSDISAPCKLKNKVIICYTKVLRIPHISVTERNDLLNEKSRQTED